MNKVTMLGATSFNEKHSVILVLDGDMENVKLFKNKKEALLCAKGLSDRRLLFHVPFNELDKFYLYAYKDFAFMVRRCVDVDLIPDDFKVIKLKLA